MKRLLLVAMLVLLVSMPTQVARADDGTGHDKLVIGQSFTLEAGQNVDGNLVVIGGATIIREGAAVKGDIVVIGGSLDLAGTTGGSAVVIGGNAVLTSKATVTKDLIALGGALQREEGATIGGEVIANLPTSLDGLQGATEVPTPPEPPKPDFRFGLGPVGRMISIVLQALAMAALAMLLAAFLHPQLDRVAQAIHSQPFAAGSIGLLTVFLAPIAFVILAVTLILLPVALAGVILLLLAWVFGVVALGILVGERLTLALQKRWEPVLTAGAGTFALGLATGIVNLMPCIGWLAPALVGLVGIGAAVTTMFGTRPLSFPALTAPPSGSAPSSGGPEPAPPQP